jgi:hypothetical protein
MSHKRRRIHQGRARLGVIECHGATLALAGEYIGSVFAGEAAAGAAATAATEAVAVEGTVYAAGAAETLGQVSALEAAAAGGAGLGGVAGALGKGLLAAGVSAAFAPDVPTVKAPAPIPLPDAEAAAQARRRAIETRMAKRGRASTILTNETGKLGD